MPSSNWVSGLSDTVTEMYGYRAWNSTSACGMARATPAHTLPMCRRAVRPSASAPSSAWVREMSPSTLMARRFMMTPAGVSWMRRPRVTSCVPTSSSRSASQCDMADCVMCMRAAASVRVPASSSTMKDSRCFTLSLRAHATWS